MTMKNLIRHPLLRNALIVLMLILSCNKVILPALGLTITGMTIQQGAITTPTLSGFALSSSSVVYGTSAPTITAPTSPSSGAITYTSSNTAVATVSGSTITLVGVGTASITATQAASGGYSSATAAVNLTVSSATPTLSGFALSANSVNFGGTAPTITAPTSPSSGAITYSSSNESVVAISGHTVVIVGIGSASIIATQAASGNYGSATATTTLTVTNTAPTLSGFALSANSITYGSAAPTITAPTSPSSGAITYSSNNTSVATISGSTITIVGSGSAIITATQAASGGYSSANVSVGLTVIPTGVISFATPGSASVNITGTLSNPATSTLAGGSYGAITYASSNTAIATVNSSGVVQGIGIGTATITATQAAVSGFNAQAAQTYLLTVNLITPVLSGFALSSTSLADDLPAPTITPPTSVSTGAITYSSSDTTIATISGSTITIVGGFNDGTVIITANQAASGNYASTSVSISLTITAPMCNGNGTPVLGVGGTYTCSCNAPFSGATCYQSPQNQPPISSASLERKTLIPMLLASLRAGRL